MISYDLPVYTNIDNDVNHINHKEVYHLSHFRKYFFDVKSNTNLRYRFWFAYDASSNFLIGTIYLFFDLIRVTGHFFKNLRLSPLRKVESGEIDDFHTL